MEDQIVKTADQAMFEKGKVTMQTARVEVMRLSEIENEGDLDGASRNVERSGIAYLDSWSEIAVRPREVNG